MDDSVELSIEMQRHDGTWVMLLDSTLCVEAESTLKKAIAFAHDAGLEIKAKVNEGEWLTYENIEFLDFVEGLRRQLK